MYNSIIVFLSAELFRFLLRVRHNKQSGQEAALPTKLHRYGLPRWWLTALFRTRSGAPTSGCSQNRQKKETRAATCFGHVEVLLAAATNQQPTERGPSNTQITGTGYAMLRDKDTLLFDKRMAVALYLKSPAPGPSAATRAHPILTI